MGIRKAMKMKTSDNIDLRTMIFTATAGATAFAGIVGSLLRQPGSEALVFTGLGLAASANLQCLMTLSKERRQRANESSRIADLEISLDRERRYSMELVQELDGCRADLADARSDLMAQRMELQSEIQSHQTNGRSLGVEKEAMARLFGTLGTQVSLAGQEAELAVAKALQSFFAVASKADSLASSAMDSFLSRGEHGVRRASELAEDVVVRLVARMRQDALDMERAAQDSEQLKALGQELEQILATIQKVADQTTLLALNAQIEAARSNENGRAFMVVADEVRQLSSQSREAANRTQALSRQMTAVCQATAKGLVASANRTKADALSAEREVDQMLAAIQESDATKEACVSNIAEASREIGMEIGEIAMALQFQDLLRQRLEHVSVPLMHLAEGLTQDVFDIQDVPGGAGAAPELRLVNYGNVTAENDVTFF
jgi:methyl-accepting chemotaxis protein